MVNNAVAVTLMVIWANTEEIIGGGDYALATYSMGIRTVFEVIGRTLVTTLVFSDRLLSMAVMDWRIMKQRLEVPGPAGEIDSMFSSMEDIFPTGKQLLQYQNEDEVKPGGKDEEAGVGDIQQRPSDPTTRTTMRDEDDEVQEMTPKNKRNRTKSNPPLLAAAENPEDAALHI